jgi:hypothetical protein
MDMYQKRGGLYDSSCFAPNVTLSPVGIIYPLSHYKALILRGEPLEMKEQHSVEDGPLRMSGTIESRHRGRMASRYGPSPRI